MPPPLAWTASLSLTISPTLIGIVFIVLCVIWIGFTLIIRYHWKQYGTGASEIFRMNFLYLSGSFTLLTLLLVSLIGYSLTAL